MKRKFYLYLVISFLVMTSPISAQTTLESEVQNLLSTVAASFQSGDLQPLDELFAAGRGVHIIEGAGVNHGWAEYRDDHLRPELEVLENLNYRYFAIEPQVRGNMAFAAFRYELSGSMEGRELDIEGRGTAVLERLAGQWKIVHLHTSGRNRQ